MIQGGIEICDGLDNNCDGDTDEGFDNVGEVCVVGVGLCEKSGVFRCSADGQSTDCSVEPGIPSDERCDGLDNDCNGQIDERFERLGEVCTQGVGACEK